MPCVICGNNSFSVMVFSKPLPIRPADETSSASASATTASRHVRWFMLLGRNLFSLLQTSLEQIARPLQSGSSVSTILQPMEVACGDPSHGRTADDMGPHKLKQPSLKTRETSHRKSKDHLDTHACVERLQDVYATCFPNQCWSMRGIESIQYQTIALRVTK